MWILEDRRIRARHRWCPAHARDEESRPQGRAVLGGFRGEETTLQGPTNDQGLRQALQRAQGPVLQGVLWYLYLRGPEGHEEGSRPNRKRFSHEVGGEAGRVMLHGFLFLPS